MYCRSKQEIRRFFEQIGEPYLRWEDFDFNPFGSKGQHEMLNMMKTTEAKGDNLKVKPDTGHQQVADQKPGCNLQVGDGGHHNPGEAAAAGSENEVEVKPDMSFFLECQLKQEQT